jgi:periplasmic divalent cation tolerance protein
MKHSRDTIVILSTAPPTESEALARMLINHRYVACVNVVPVRSFYRWKREFCDDQEHLLIVKTTRERVDEVIKAIKSIHSYETPEIIALPVIDGYLPYLEWVYQETHSEV